MIFLLAVLASLDGSAIPPQAQGTWAPSSFTCRDEVNLLTISADRLQWYDAEGFVLLGKAYVGEGAEEGSIVVRIEGTNIDSDAMFFTSDLKIRVLDKARIAIDRFRSDGKTTSTTSYRRCTPKLK